jgi:hypothetical protein
MRAPRSLAGPPIGRGAERVKRALARRADLRRRLAEKAAAPGADPLWAELLADHDAATEARR